MLLPRTRLRPCWEDVANRCKRLRRRLRASLVSLARCRRQPAGQLYLTPRSRRSLARVLGLFAFAFALIEALPCRLLPLLLRATLVDQHHLLVDRLLLVPMQTRNLAAFAQLHVG